MPFKLLRFLNNLDDHVSKSVHEKLMQNRVPYDTLTAGTQTARWIEGLMGDLAVEIGADEAKAVMEACGQQCIGQSVLDKARLLKQEASDLDEFLEKLNHAHIGGGKLQREGSVIYASYERCYCGSVSKTRQPISSTYCQCSCGWYKKLFEATLEKPVKVELLDSIIHGADTCQFIIHI
jgi:predicted hydrocarbon binding protein